MSRARFRFSATILQRLGEELNPSPDQSILELVKNAYDADARACTIELLDTDHPGGSIRIRDNGDGMDGESIIDGWLVLGRSTKSQSQRTRLNRIKAGSKGLGRLAALRMGRNVVLITRPRESPKNEYRLCIDWSEFDKVELVDQVDLNIDHEKVTRTDPGTEILIEQVKEPLNRTVVRKLARSLILLADPFGDDPHAFKPVLHVPEFEDLERLVQARYFDEAEYHLVGELDRKGRGTAKVVDYRGRTIFKAGHSEIARDDGPYLCPPTHFDLWAFILDQATFRTRSVTIRDVREWLQAFGGVHLYENGLRVNPYGNPGNDWLDMNLARVRSPEERPSTNNSIGRIRVDDSEGLLVQKTDRSGFIETTAFLEIQRFARDTLEWMAKKRLEDAERRRTTERTGSASSSKRAKAGLQDEIERVPGKLKKRVKTAFEKYDRAKAREVNALRSEVQLYRTLSTAGITASTFAHESAGNPIKIITHAIKTVARRGRHYLGGKYDTSIGQAVEMIANSLEALKVLGNVTISLLDHEKRRSTRVEIHSVIKNVVGTFKPFFDERKVNVVAELDSGRPFLRGSSAAIEAIVTNLLNNSLIWLEKNQDGNRTIIVRTTISGNVLTLRVMDNGPGIKEISKEDIWLPGQTTRANGTGLGLTIVRDTVKDLGGNADAVENGELGGAEIVIEVPIIGA